MNLNSPVCLSIHCKTKKDSDLVSAHLGIQPSRVRELKAHQANKETDSSDFVSYTWIVDSPKNVGEAALPNRLSALADAIAPFGEKLSSLDPLFRRQIDVVYRLTPQHPNRISGEFVWFGMPAALMQRFVSWNLDISYEFQWFNQSD